jgi:thioredoxin 2
MSDSVHTVCPHCSAVNRVPADRPAAEAICGVCKSRLFTGEPIALTSKTFDKTIERNDAPLVRALPRDGADLRKGREGA